MCNHSSYRPRLLWGELYKCEVDGISHWYNKIDGKIVDLTKQQFQNRIVDYQKETLKTRERLLENPDTFKRYQLLKQNVEVFYQKLEMLNQNIHQCGICKQLVEKFENSTTIYYGTNSKLLLLGETPANNGWRKSKMLWRDPTGKLLPSGVILQKLLDIVGLDLFDLTFTEAVKCFPCDRSSLKICQNNCHSYLLQQIELLEPELILCLGDYATRSILNQKYQKFSEVVGTVFPVTIGSLSVQVLPIYHPSPISPKSDTGNAKIFERLKTML